MLAKVDPRVKRLIIQKARKYGVDPAAALAVAAGEGGIRFGAVGDNGSSFGPFQLHVGGALPKGKGAGWANSPAGVDYALRLMSQHAKGLSGADAVGAIVRKFERPADPDTSVANAIKRLGASAPVTPDARGAAQPSLLAGRTGAAPAIPAQAFGTLNEIFTRVGLKPLDIVGDLPLSRQKPAPSVPGRSNPSLEAAPAQPPPKGKLPRVDLMVHLIQKAQAMGLSVRENPFVETVDPVHVKGSDHYRIIGRRGKKKVGAGIDVSGDPKLMRAFFDYAGKYAGRGLKDAFYDPAGFSFDNGRRWDKTIGGHGDHVHVSVG